MVLSSTCEKHSGQWPNNSRESKCICEGIVNYRFSRLFLKNLSKPNTPLNRTFYSVPRVFGLEKFHCIYIYIYIALSRIDDSINIRKFAISKLSEFLLLFNGNMKNFAKNKHFVSLLMLNLHNKLQESDKQKYLNVYGETKLHLAGKKLVPFQPVSHSWYIKQHGI